MRIAVSPLTLLLALALALPAAGCGEEQAEEPIAPEPSAEPSPGSAAEAEGGEAPAAPEGTGPVVTGDTFELRAAAADGYSAGELSQFGIHLTGRDGWHVNLDYPIRVEMTAPEGVGLTKSELGKDDAAEFGDELARFDVPFTPAAAGEHEVSAHVYFAMCSEANCIMEDRTLALNLAVQ